MTRTAFTLSGAAHCSSASAVAFSGRCAHCERNSASRAASPSLDHVAETTRGMAERDEGDDTRRGAGGAGRVRAREPPRGRIGDRCTSRPDATTKNRPPSPRWNRISNGSTVEKIETDGHTFCSSNRFSHSRLIVILASLAQRAAVFGRSPQHGSTINPVRCRGVRRSAVLSHARLRQRTLSKVVRGCLATSAKVQIPKAKLGCNVRGLTRAAAVPRLCPQQRRGRGVRVRTWAAQRDNLLLVGAIGLPRPPSSAAATFGPRVRLARIDSAPRSAPRVRTFSSRVERATARYGADI